MNIRLLTRLQQRGLMIGPKNRVKYGKHLAKTQNFQLYCGKIAPSNQFLSWSLIPKLS